MSAYASRYFGQPQPEHRGPSFAVSLAATAMLFALAFGAMRTLPDLSISSHSRVEPPIVVHLPPVAPTKPLAEPIPTPAPPALRRTESRVVPPVSVPIGLSSPSQVAPLAPPGTAPITTGAPGTAAPRDSVAASRTAAAEDYLRRSMLPPATGLGTPAVPDWTKADVRLPNTEAVRNQIIHEKMQSFAEYAKNHVPTGREKAELEASQMAARVLQRRVSTSGNSRDLAMPQGQGKDGVGAVAGPGIVSIDFPLFSSGPSKAQRKKNEAIDADYQARLRRLGDRALLKRDSVIADSLRLDSLRRDSLARRPKSPSPDPSGS